MKEATEEDIYGYSHRLELALTGPHGIKRSKRICEENKETLFKYHDFLKARKLSLPRREKLMKALKRLGELLGNESFKDVTREEMEHVVGSLKPKLRGSRNSELAASTLRDLKSYSLIQA